MKKKTKIPTFLGILTLLAAMILGVLLINRQQVFRLGAASQETPKDLRISNVTDASFTVSWVTGKDTVGTVRLDNTEIFQSVFTEEKLKPGKTHSVNVSNLKGETGYTFKILSGKSYFDNNGVPWLVRTGKTIINTAKPMLLSGKIVKAGGVPVSGGLVYLTIGGGSPISTVTSENGSWIIQAKGVRTLDLSSYLPVNVENALIEIYINGATEGVASAQVYLRYANPVPEIVMGNFMDFKNREKPLIMPIPESSLELPENSFKSGFILGYATVSAPLLVTIENPREGQSVSGGKATFSGLGPAGKNIAISLNSSPNGRFEEIIGKNGKWSWKPPANLYPGSRSVFISWADDTGVERTVTRSFYVY